MLNTLFLTLTPKKLHNLQNRQVTCKTRNKTMTRAHLELILTGSHKTKIHCITYFTIGFSVISPTINKPMLEIHLKSMKQTELRLKCLIIIGTSKLSQIVSPKTTAQIMSRNKWEFKQKNLTLQAGHNH